MEPRYLVLKLFRSQPPQITQSAAQDHTVSLLMSEYVDMRLDQVQHAVCAQIFPKQPNHSLTHCQSHHHRLAAKDDTKSMLNVTATTWVDGVARHSATTSASQQAPAPGRRC